MCKRNLNFNIYLTFILSCTCAKTHLLSINVIDPLNIPKRESSLKILVLGVYVESIGSIRYHIELSFQVTSTSLYPAGRVIVISSPKFLTRACFVQLASPRLTTINIISIIFFISFNFVLFSEKNCNVICTCANYMYLHMCKFDLFFNIKVKNFDCEVINNLKVLYNDCLIFNSLCFTIKYR